MSDNTIYVFVKGHSNAYAYMIVNSDFKELYKSDCCIIDENRPIYSDWHAMCDSMRYIFENIGQGQIPKSPVVKIFTSYEENFEVASELSEPDNFKDMYDRFIDAKLPLERGLSKTGKNGQDDSVKVFFLPKKFKDHMKEVITIMKKAGVKPNRPTI